MLVGDAPGGAPTAEAVMARAQGENFPVASRLLPRRVRSHLLAVYGFALERLPRPTANSTLDQGRRGPRRFRRRG